MWKARAKAIRLALLREEAAYLGAGFTSLIHLFTPGRIIMGGGVSQAFDLLIDDMPVVRAGLGENSGLVGAAALVSDAVNRRT